jgi:hypothetical protein
MAPLTSCRRLDSSRLATGGLDPDLQALSEAADERVTFGLDGKTYEIDLSDDHAATLRDRLSAYSPLHAAPRATAAPYGGRGGTSMVEAASNSAHPLRVALDT